MLTYRDANITTTRETCTFFPQFQLPSWMDEEKEMQLINFSEASIFVFLVFSRCEGMYFPPFEVNPRVIGVWMEVKVSYDRGHLCML